MSTLVENANRIYNAKQSIVSSINSKGVSVSSDTPIENLPTYINNIVELKGETKSVTPTTSEQIITPTSPKNGLTQVTVNPVTNSIDVNIVAENIKDGVSILGVTGTYNNQKPEQSKTVTPTAAGLTVTPDSGKVLSSVVINGDNNLLAGNIKKDVEIFGVTGTYEGSGGGGSSYIIRVAEFSGVDIELKDNNDTVLDIATTSSTGITEFTVNNTGTYTITVSSDNSTVWTNSVTIDEIGVYWVKGRVLNNCTAAQIHEVCQAGIASKVFNLRDVWTFTDTRTTPGILNNQKFYITHFFDNGDGTESIQFWLANDDISTTYQINPYIRYITSASGTSSNTTYSNQGGYKYSTIRQKFLPAGSTIYQHGSGLKNDDSTVAGGIKFSDLKYTDTGLHCHICSWDRATDTFTELSALATQSQGAPYFIKGYFKSVGTLTEDQFNAGVYYTFNANGGSGNMGTYAYNSAITYSSSTTYYGLYETLQEDGVFYDGLKPLIDSGYIELMELKQLAGNNQTQYTVINDYISIPSSSELTGLVNTYKELDGTTTKSNAYYGENASNHNPKWDGVEYNDLFTNNNTWIRSVYSYNTFNFVYLYTYGILINSNVYNSCRVRPCFRFN